MNCSRCLFRGDSLSLLRILALPSLDIKEGRKERRKEGRKERRKEGKKRKEKKHDVSEDTGPFLTPEEL